MEGGCLIQASECGLGAGGVGGGVASPTFTEWSAAKHQAPEDLLKRNVFYFNSDMRLPEKKTASSALECQLLLFAFISAGIANSLSEWKTGRDSGPSITPLINSLCKQTRVWF